MYETFITYIIIFALFCLNLYLLRFNNWVIDLIFLLSFMVIIVQSYQYDYFIYSVNLTTMFIFLVFTINIFSIYNIEDYNLKKRK